MHRRPNNYQQPPPLGNSRRVELPLSPRTNKLSLKNARSIPTDKSTTCNSTYGGFQSQSHKKMKKSIKDLLLVNRNRNHASEYCISLRYVDIQ